MTDEDDRYARGRALFHELNPKAVEGLEEALGDVSPDLVRLAAELPFADIFSRSGLDKRTRQLIILASLATRGDAATQLSVHIRIALNLGLTPAEIAEAFLQLAPYSGFPTSINATLALKQVLED